ncbi:hypothetical protein NQ314_015093 [Rhamnusium bicolor]|uniref:PiggyBac transposable element-derived protein domain-containing protein n=1 Tax=Rhamnusium bicolor TaxID=1586634 RepID=A0AAV8WZM8_9CUCU|nr:hypothetical protein NQ314_015093 [Rhamnusium bicolor]
MRTSHLPKNDPIWGRVVGKYLQEFPFTEQNSGIKPEIYENFYDKTPYDFYELNDDILNLIVVETNCYVSFQAAVVPQEELCIDDTLVPFSACLSVRQYIKNNRHKFGITLFKLYIDKGYTYNLRAYCGTDNTEGPPAKFSPKDVFAKKLKKNEIVATESNTDVVVFKWKDKRNVLVLSTRHNDELVRVRQRGGEVQKPKIISQYNKCKAFIDLSDQMKACSSSLKKGMK